jgi:hypothetical protein
VSIDASQCQVVTDRLGSAARDLRALPARLDAAVAAAIRDIQGDEALRDIAPQLTAKLGATADATKVVVGAILAIVDRGRPLTPRRARRCWSWRSYGGSSRATPTASPGPSTAPPGDWGRNGTTLPARPT